MSDSVQPHRWQPTRLPNPWDSPGKNTGVGCHFLLQCMKVKSESEVAQSCPTLRDPMDCSLSDSSVHGIFQARVLPLPSPEHLTKYMQMRDNYVVEFRGGEEREDRVCYAMCGPHNLRGSLRCRRESCRI